MNDMGYQKISALVNQINKQTLGATGAVSIDASNFVSTMTTLLRNGTDPVYNALSHMWSTTIFEAKQWNSSLLKSIELGLPEWGAAVRRGSPIAMDTVNDAAMQPPVVPLTDGGTVDQWEIKKQAFVQTNFYGGSGFMQHYSTTQKQMREAFRSEQEFMAFNAMNMQERANDLEQFRLDCAIALQTNFICAIYDEAIPERVRHVLTEYNTQTGQSLTPQTVFRPENYKPFILWLSAYIQTLTDLMSQRSMLYQQNLTGKPVMRWIAPGSARVAIHSEFANSIEAMVKSDVRNLNYLSFPKYEKIPYWQSVKEPKKLLCKPVYTLASGEEYKATENVAIDNCIGIIHAPEAMQYCFIDKQSYTTPLNAKGLFYNTYVHAWLKTLQDNTQKAVILLLD